MWGFNRYFKGFSVNTIKHTLMVSWLLFHSFFVGSVSAETEFKIISLKHRSANDVIPTLEPLMRADEMVTGSDYNLFVRANPDTLANIERMLATLDVARQNLRITISNSDVSDSNQSNLGISGHQRMGDVEINVPRQNNTVTKSNGQTITRQSSGIRVGKQYGLGVDANARNTQQTTRSQQFVNVQDGAQSFIRVGQIVPFTQRWITITQRYITQQNVTDFREITTGFAVRPRIVGENTTSNQIEVEVTPRIAQINTKQNQVGYVDFQELNTTVRVNRGEWLDLGQLMQNRDEVSGEILRESQNNSYQNTKVMIKVD